MAKKSYPRGKGRQNTRQFFALPHELIKTKKYQSLSAHAVKLIIDLGVQYNGRNNGDLCATMSMMKKVGWKSSSTLYKAIQELLDAEFIIRTRTGGQHLATLYAMTWQPINECGGKLEITSTQVAPGKWKDR